jgi:hypothetical protein
MQITIQLFVYGRSEPTSQLCPATLQLPIEFGEGQPPCSVNQVSIIQRINVQVPELIFRKNLSPILCVQTADQREEIRDSYGDQRKWNTKTSSEWNCSRWLKITDEEVNYGCINAISEG